MNKAELLKKIKEIHKQKGGAPKAGQLKPSASERQQAPGPPSSPPTPTPIASASVKPPPSITSASGGPSPPPTSSDVAKYFKIKKPNNIPATLSSTKPPPPTPSITPASGGPSLPPTSSDVAKYFKIKKPNNISATLSTTSGGPTLSERPQSQGNPIFFKTKNISLQQAPEGPTSSDVAKYFKIKKPNNISATLSPTKPPPPTPSKSTSASGGPSPPSDHLAKFFKKNKTNAKAASQFEKHLDPHSGKYYYFNLVTQQSTWNNPNNIAKAAANAKAAAEANAVVKVTPALLNISAAMGQQILKKQSLFAQLVLPNNYNSNNIRPENTATPESVSEEAQSLIQRIKELRQNLESCAKAIAEQLQEIAEAATTQLKVLQGSNVTKEQIDQAENIVKQAAKIKEDADQKKVDIQTLVHRLDKLHSEARVMRANKRQYLNHHAAENRKNVAAIFLQIAVDTEKSAEQEVVAVKEAVRHRLLDADNVVKAAIENLKSEIATAKAPKGVASKITFFDPKK